MAGGTFKEIERKVVTDGRWLRFVNVRYLNAAGCEKVSLS